MSIKRLPNGTYQGRSLVGRVWLVWCYLCLAWCVVAIVLDVFGVLDLGWGPK